MQDIKDISFRELKKAAIIRRASRFIEWIGRDQYAVYVDETSTDKLVRLIKLVIYAHEKNVDKEDWLPFLKRYRKLIKAANEKLETEEDVKVYHARVVKNLQATLEKYKVHISLVLSK